MSKRTIHFLLMLLVGVIGCILYYFLCSCCYVGGNSKNNTTKDAVKSTPVVSTPPPTNNNYKNAFLLNDDKGSFSLKSNDHFNFDVNGFGILRPISTDLNSKIGELKGYLGQHPEKELDIIGLYNSKENNTSAYENLGIARATAVKNYLVNQGIASKQLNALGKLNDDLEANANIYYGPLNYKFNTANSIEEENAKIAAELEALKKEILADPLQLRFQTNSSNLTLTQQQRAKMAKLSRYLDKSESGKLILTGHTDNTGNAQNNIALGLSRAETIKKYFISNGISAAKIETASKGPNQPIDDNNTAEGRHNNRRVEVSIN